MNLLYLGTAERRIFGIYEPPASTAGRPRAAVLCYPWGAEYIYAHRSIRQLATRLAMSGYHTLRFDYFGTGDSAGEPAQTDLAGCEFDLESALETMKDIAGVARVALIGLRAGANIAANAAVRLPEEVDGLVLWDPIVSGEAHVRDLRIADPQGSADTHCSRMLRDLHGIDLRSVLDALPQRCLILATKPLESHHPLTRAARSGAPTVQIESMTAPCPWVESATTTGTLPARAFNRIVEWLG
jgi:pimeloyl-ACP methyl ester carboxylesterase